jgi:hypothetical protein
MIKYNVEIVLAQKTISTKKRQLDMFDISLMEALDYVKRVSSHEAVLNARIIDETGREINISSLN